MQPQRALFRTVAASRLVSRSQSPQLQLQLQHQLSSHIPVRNLAGAPLFAGPTSVAPESTATPPPTPPLCQSCSTRTAGLFFPTPCTRPYSTTTYTSPRANSSKISSSRAAQIARHLSGSSSTSRNSNTNDNSHKMSYTTRKVAAPNTLEHRVYIEKDGVPVSPFHDVPLFANQEQTILNMIVEIPRWTNAKLEVSLPPSPSRTPLSCPACCFATLWSFTRPLASERSPGCG